MEISILNNFSDNPGLRHCDVSEKSGEEFYHSVLNKEFKQAFEQSKILTVNLDYTEGYAPSFLDESFGNLVYDFSLSTVKKFIKIVSIQEPDWINKIENEFYVNWEARRIKQERPKVTKNHDAWYRLINNKIESAVWEQPAV